MGKRKKGRKKGLGANPNPSTLEEHCQWMSSRVADRLPELCILVSNNLRKLSWQVSREGDRNLIGVAHITRWLCEIQLEFQFRCEEMSDLFPQLSPVSFASFDVIADHLAVLEQRVNAILATGKDPADRQMKGAAFASDRWSQTKSGWKSRIKTFEMRNTPVSEKEFLRRFKMSANLFQQLATDLKRLDFKKISRPSGVQRSK